VRPSEDIEASVAAVYRKIGAPAMTAAARGCRSGLAVALRAGEAPTSHGVRPHVVVTFAWSDLARKAGIGELGFTGPITYDEIKPLLADVAISRVILDADSMPLEVSKRTRNVPAALVTALALRDRGCAWSGCDAPPGYCDVAHGNDPYGSNGMLSLANAVLLCKRHHRRFDHGNYKLVINGNDVRFEPIEPTANAPP
jgi:hypothetical protein